MIKYIKYLILLYNLKNGEHFTKKEKRIIIKAIKYTREFLLNNYCEGICISLERSISKFDNGLYNKLASIYHNPTFYCLNGIPIERTYGYWWNCGEVEPRIKALNVLEQAVIND